MTPDKTTKLIAEISALETKSQEHASKNHRFAYLTAIVAVLGSVSATIMINIDDVPKWLTSIMAILPAAVGAATSILRFEPKSQWFYERLHKLSELRRRLEFGAEEPGEIARELSALEQQYQENWVKFGFAAGQQKKTSGASD